MLNHVFAFSSQFGVSRFQLLDAICEDGLIRLELRLPRIKLLLSRGEKLSRGCEFRCLLREYLLTNRDGRLPFFPFLSQCREIRFSFGSDAQLLFFGLNSQRFEFHMPVCLLRLEFRLSGRDVSSVGFQTRPLFIKRRAGLVDGC